MKKVINITLGGIVFAIEQDAYDALAVYLDAVKGNLQGDDASEINSDIETAIAEKFIARKRNEKIAITTTDVEAMITDMGSPADYSEETTEGEAASVDSVSTNDTKRRLYRDTDDVVVAGVASGIAHYFAIDLVIVRMLFLASILFGGFGVLLYIVLWLIVPTADTTTERYAMRGSAVNLKEIAESVKKDIERVSAENKDRTKGLWGNIRAIFVKLFDVLGVMLRALVSLLRLVFGFLFVIVGALGIAGLVSTYSVILLSDKVLFPQEVQIALETLMSSSLGIVAMLSSFVMMVIPLNILVIAGAGLISKKNYFTTAKVVTFAVVWIVAVVLAGTASALQVEKVMQKIGVPHAEDGSYQIHINVEDDQFYIGTEPAPVVEEDVISLPPEEMEAKSLESM